MEEFETRNSKGKFLLVLLGSLAFVAMGLWFLFSPESFADDYSGSMITTIGGVSVLFFGLCSLIGLRQMFDFSPKIRGDRSGLLAASLSTETIPWAVIRDIEFASMNAGANTLEFAILKMHQEDINQIRFSKMYEMTKGANMAFGIKGPHFALNNMVHHPDEIRDALTELWAHYAA